MVLNFIRNTLKNKNRNYILLSQIANAIIALVSGKLIALYILPEDFGVYNLQFAAYTFFATLLVSPFIQFVKATNKTLLPKIGSKLYLFTLIVLGLVAYFSFISFLYIYYGLNDLLLLVIFLFFISLSTINKILSDYLNITNKFILFSKLSVLESFTGLAFLWLFFVLGFSFVKDYQVLWLMQLFGIIVGITFFVSKYEIFKPVFQISYRSFLKKYFRFAGPLMFLALWAWSNNYFDRYAIEYFLSMKEVGVYNASYSVGSKFFIMLSPIFMVFLTPLVYAVVKKGSKKSSINKYGFYYTLVGIPILAIIYYLRNIIGGLLLSENYEEGFFLIFWIALAYFILTLTQLYELIFYSEHKTRVILVSNIIAALFNILLNIVLIPKYGIQGAAFATCFSFLAHFCFIFFNFRRM